MSEMPDQETVSECALAEFLNEAQINQLVSALKIIGRNCTNYGQVRLIVERGKVSLVAFEVTIKV